MSARQSYSFHLGYCRRWERSQLSLNDLLQLPRAPSSKYSHVTKSLVRIDTLGVQLSTGCVRLPAKARYVQCVLDALASKYIFEPDPQTRRWSHCDSNMKFNEISAISTALRLNIRFPLGGDLSEGNDAERAALSNTVMYPAGSASNKLRILVAIYSFYNYDVQ